MDKGSKLLLGLYKIPNSLTYTTHILRINALPARGDFGRQLINGFANDLDPEQARQIV